MKRFLPIIGFVIARATLAHEGEPVEEHTWIEIISENPVPYAWIGILVVLAIITAYFWHLSRKQARK